MNLQECFLKIAQIEEEGFLLYKKFSEECSEKLKPVVILISKEEEEHKKIMLELSNNEKLKEVQLDKDVEKVFQKQVQYLYNNDKKLNLNSEKEFFIFALQLEKNSVEIYTKLLCVFEMDSYGYRSFEELIKQERKHMIFILNKLYELK
ncbi:MAG: rubrerythrin [Clostridium sp.]